MLHNSQELCPFSGCDEPGGQLKHRSRPVTFANVPERRGKEGKAKGSFPHETSFAEAEAPTC